MADLVEYQIYIGYRDPQAGEEILSEKEIIALLTAYFERVQMGFSLMSVKGGYYYEDGWYDTENTICISIVGDSEMDIIRIANAVSMFMNQECSLVVKQPLKMKYM